MFLATFRGRLSLPGFKIKSMPVAVGQEALHVHGQLYYISTTAGKSCWWPWRQQEVIHLLCYSILFKPQI